VFLAVPFLRFLRGFTVLRTARVAGVFSATVRGSRSAGRLLSGRLGWLATVTAVVIVGASQFLFATGTYSHYGDALHGAALAAITGEPLAADGALARWTEVGLSVYSVAVFATLAGSLGAFFLRRAPDTPPVETPVARTLQRED
jgi:voltage-gated potassium channel